MVALEKQKALSDGSPHYGIRQAKGRGKIASKYFGKEKGDMGFGCTTLKNKKEQE